MQPESRMSILFVVVRQPALALIFGFLACAQQAQTPPTGTATPVNRFEGSAQFKGKGGRPQNAHVTIRQWKIPGKQTVEALPERGFLLVTVRAGDVTTTIGGKREKHTTDDFWTVPENAKMSVEATGEAAVLEVISVMVR